MCHTGKNMTDSSRKCNHLNSLCLKQKRSFMFFTNSERKFDLFFHSRPCVHPILQASLVQQCLSNAAPAGRLTCWANCAKLFGREVIFFALCSLRGKEKRSRGFFFRPVIEMLLSVIHYATWITWDIMRLMIINAEKYLRVRWITIWTWHMNFPGNKCSGSLSP